MNDKNIIEEINVLKEENTKESHKKIIELINKLSQEKQKAYEVIKNRSEIRILEIEISELEESDKKNRIYLTGRLIKQYKKQVGLETDEKDKMQVKYQLLELQKKQREETKDYNNSNKNMTISERLAATIKDIASAIEIFVNEKDILKKIENIIKSTIIGISGNAVFMIAFALLPMLFGGGINWAIIAKIIPAAGYVGLTNVIRNILTETNYQKYQYYQSDEYKEYVNKFQEENKTLLEELDSLLKENKDSYKIEDKIKLNETIINKVNEVSSKITDDALRKTYDLQALALMRENKKLCEKLVNNYLHGRSNNKEKYELYNKKLSSLNIDIFKKENSFKEAFKAGTKEAITSFATMIIARAVLHPNNLISLLDLKTYVLPLLLSLTNGLQTGLSYSGKLKLNETKEEKEIKPKDKNLFENLFKEQNLQMAY